MTAPLTVLHIINTGGPGGAETVCANLVRRLDARRWRPIAVVPDRGWIYQELVAAGVTVVVLAQRDRSDLPGYFRSLMRLATRNDVRLVHGHLFGPSFTAGLLGLVRRIPAVATLHGQTDLDPHESFRRAKFGLLRRGVSRVVFVSEPLREFFLDTGLLHRDQTAVIPNGVEVSVAVDNSRSAVRSELGISTNQFLVGAVGNMRTAKGYDVFLRAAALLKARSNVYRFVIVGDGKEIELERELVTLRDSLGLSDEVRFLGFRSDVGGVMSAFDVYALTSRTEGFSLALIEAMTLGLPVVATRCGGPEQILDGGDTGLLVENGSPEAVATAIDRLRCNPAERVRFAEAGRTSAAMRFTMKSHVASYERLYEECLNELRWPFNGPLGRNRWVPEVRGRA